MLLVILTVKYAIAPLIAAAGISAASGLGESIFNAVQTKKNNEAQRQFEKDMYNRQRADNRSDWDTTNAYNHPAAQMARLTEAGLNPNLVYGNGSAAITAPSISAATPRVSRSQAPQLDLAAVSSFGNSLMQAEQLKLNKEMVGADVALKQAQSTKAYVDAAGGNIKNSKIEAFMDKQMAAYDAQASKNNQATETDRARMWLIDAQTQNIVQKTDIDRAMREPNMRKAEADIAYKVAITEAVGWDKAKINAYINSQNMQQRINEFQLQMSKSGIEKGDSFYWRAFAAFIRNSIQDWDNVPVQTPINK